MREEDVDRLKQQVEQRVGRQVSDAEWRAFKSALVDDAATPTPKTTSSGRRTTRQPLTGGAKVVRVVWICIGILGVAVLAYFGMRLGFRWIDTAMRYPGPAVLDRGWEGGSGQDDDFLGYGALALILFLILAAISARNSVAGIIGFLVGTSIGVLTVGVSLLLSIDKPGWSIALGAVTALVGLLLSLLLGLGIYLAPQERDLGDIEWRRRPPFLASLFALAVLLIVILAVPAYLASWEVAFPEGWQPPSQLAVALHSSAAIVGAGTLGVSAILFFVFIIYSIFSK